MSLLVYRLPRSSPLIEPASRGVFVAFVVWRPGRPDAREVWAREGRVLFRCADAIPTAEAMLRFAAPTVPEELLPELRRIEDLDGAPECIGEPSDEDRGAVADAAAREVMARTWPGRLERLVAAGRLPRRS